MSLKEHLVVWNSTFRSNPFSDPCNCTVHYDNVDFMHQVINCRLKSATIPQEFDNIYGTHTKLYLLVGATALTITIPAGRYNINTLATALTAAFLAEATVDNSTWTVVGDVLNVATNAGVDYVILSTAYLHELGIYTSLNHDMGIGPMTSADDGLDTSTYTGVLPYKPNLSGPRIVFISSASLGSGHAVHASKNITDLISSVDLTKVDAGYQTHLEYPEANIITFHGPRNISDLDITITDEYEETLTLAPHFGISLEFIVSTVLDY